MSVNVQLAILHICLVVKEKKTKKAAKNNDQMTKFLQHLESSGKFRKKIIFKIYIITRCIEKYIDVYNLVLNFWKTNKGTHSNHIRQKNDKKAPKMTKITKFLWHLEYQGISGKTFSLMYIKVYWYLSSERQFYQQFHCFLFHKNILFNSKLLRY